MPSSLFTNNSHCTLINLCVKKAQTLIYILVNINKIRKIIFRSELYRVYTAEMLMQKPQVTLNTEDSMSTIMDKFQKCDAGTLPVLKSDGKFVGFVSRTHLYASYRQIMKDFSEE